MSESINDKNLELVQKTQMSNHEKLGIIIKSIFSLHFIKSLISSFAYYLFEHVYWKFDITTRGVYRVHATTSIRNAKNISLGFDTRITTNCIIWAGKTSKITIGNNVLIGPGVQLHASNHGYALDKGPMTYQEKMEKDIILGNDVWIGGNSVITAGVTLADGIIVAAGSTVTKSFDEKNIIIGGVPAKKITQRN
ncbi:acyltransferase [Sulfurovum sp. AR]|uniref:acyltransferase n=1 Tax=Sulfurovum sp. AR TaxID=1165841 RepID=UPI00025C4F24|nr:acyltransferase [Sulfurovum sp. AR]EIF51171.1 hexapeptide repeat-containing transferase [Sulfurovum sp. AR]